MAPPDRWYHHLPAATAVVPCEGEEHRVTWRWGKLKLEDHDLGSERAMLVLGGEPAPCLQALQFWGEQFGMRPEQFHEMRRRMGDHAVLAPREFDLVRGIGMVLSLERAWRRSRYLDKQGRMIERELKERAMPAIRAHLTAAKQEFGSRVIRSVTLHHVPAGYPLSVRGEMDTVSVSAEVTLSSDWIVHVWARRMAVVDGALVLEVTGPGSSPGSQAISCVRWERRRAGGVAEPVVVAAEATPDADGTGWRLVAGEAGAGRR